MKMINKEQVTKYFKKLNIEPKEPSLELVKELQKKHLATFSFNNIAVIQGKEVSLDIEDIVEKIVTKNLGGYCFEHNSLMYEVLKSLGFNVRILLAKVLNNRDIEVPRTHRVTLLEWEDEQYLVDVGFGAMCPQVVLNINSQELKEGYKIVPAHNNSYELAYLKEEGYFTLYSFDLVTYTEADCAMGNFYSSHHPSAIFVNNFVIALRLLDVTLSFRNGVYYRIGKDKIEVFEIESVEALHKMINEEFKISLSVEECEYLFLCYKT